MTLGGTCTLNVAACRRKALLNASELFREAPRTRSRQGRHQRWSRAERSICRDDEFKQQGIDAQRQGRSSS